MSETDRERVRRRKKRSRVNLRPLFAAIAFSALVLTAVFVSIFIKKYTPTKERVDLQEYYHLQEEDDIALVLDHQILEETAKCWDGQVYLRFETVQQYLNQRFYWDANENILRYTTDSDVISVNAGESSYLTGKKSDTEPYTIVRAEGEAVYLALAFVQKFTNLEFTQYGEPSRVQITASWGEVSKAAVKKDTQIRVRGGIKSPIVSDVKKGSEITVIESGDKWSRVCTEDGMVGYMSNKRLGEVKQEVVSREFLEPQFTHLLKDGKVSLGWHQVTSQEANDRIADVLQSTKGVNVISPTWFYLNDNEGNIYSLASKDYVEYCHQQNVEVWALVSNLENPDADSGYVLTHTSARDYLTNQIIAAAIEYNLDGINVDFEALSAEVGDAYIQFIRELSIKCENNDLILSVDNYVPSSYTAFYNRKEQAVFADYVIIMAYDEHYSGSEDIGSVSSINFVRNGVADTLQEVPAEQTILGLPFYSRVWELTPKEGAGEDVASASEDYVPYTFTCTEEGMQTIEDRYTANGAQAIWSEEDGQYVAQYESEGKTYKMWIENEVSLEEKLKVMKEHQLAGAAYWKLGLERQQAWDTIIKYVN
ncbi:glycosyl hydrolase family 18 [Lachnospiraceae bacterium]|nr:glycosyl hydrolase family 18 [Lachnospiraceae bacterium]